MSDLIRRLQQSMSFAGFYDGLIDGVWGNRSQAAFDSMVQAASAPASIVRTLAWGRDVSADFRYAVFAIADEFGWGPDGASYLMACMAFESGQSFNPAVKNAAGSGATGLIQFMPTTARQLGTTTEDLAKMTAVQQLAYVRKYLAQFSKLRSPSVTLPDLYMSILMPRYIGAPEDTAIFIDGTTAFRQNSGLDADRNGKVTKAEAAGKVFAMLERGRKPEHLWRG